MKRTSIAIVLSFIAVASASHTSAAPFTGSYIQNFDSMGTAGTAAPTGWIEYSLAGSHDDYRHAGSTAAITTTFLPSAFPDTINNADGTSTTRALTTNATLTAATPSNQRAAGGFNFGLAASPSDRALGTSPTGVGACELELQLTNNSGAAISSLSVGYDIRCFSTTVDANGYTTSPDAGAEEFPGYWLFYSLDNGSTWTNVSSLNPTRTGPGGIIVPNSIGVTNVPATTIALGSAWTDGANLRFRWFDDNAQSPSPDQLLGLDNVAINTVPEPATISLFAGASALLALRRRSVR
ncbi:MAG TPA: PEP-CTERM sorting domain-containing protein [Tepidisphaeraceae bacterium]|jgi:hypothetical protein|nr:PEP-CTERM sorting domain-containing protein [Tepidisphaeraceae bacterium]